LVRQMSGEIAYWVDLTYGVTGPSDSSLFPGMVSALAPETSLRLSAGYYDGDNIGLTVRSTENEIIGETSIFKAYAYGITGDSVGSTFALSPDGQTVAFLNEGVLHLWREGEVTALGVEAD